MSLRLLAEPTHLGVELVTAVISLVLVIIPTWTWGIKYLKKKQEEKEKRLEKEADLIKKITNIDSIVSDIDQELKRHIAQFSADIKLSDKPIFICNTDGRWKDVNPALMTLFGATKDELIGMGWINSVIDDERDHVHLNWKSAIEPDIDTSFTCNVINKSDNSVSKFEYRAIIIRDTNDRIVHIGGTVKKLKPNELKQK